VPPAPPAPLGQRLAGLRLLVVEDNPINQEVARDLLQDEGATVALAGDGRQGIAAVQAADPCFDAVLMDVQMPVMDGHAAASHLRRELGLGQLPIIAMTANAMPSDRAASLAAGMNDHVGKPFDLDELVAVLRRHVPARPVPPDTAAGRRGRKAVSLTPEIRGLAQAAGFDLDGALLRLAGRVDVYKRLATSFDERLAALPAEFAALLQPARRAEAERLAHTIKGVAATLGALRLATMAGEVEQALQQWPPQPPQAEWQPRWESAIQAARAALAVLLPRLESPATPAAAPHAILGNMSVKPAAPSAALSATASAAASAAAPAALAPDDTLREGLHTLAGLLAEADMAATECFADLALAPGAGGWRQQLAPLAAPMAALDFPTALAVCRAILARLDPPAAAAPTGAGMPR
jgi:CheY-like chemotaxis protein/HPt (histidine-containing phosphotransfer) domain-containing protein